MENDDSAVAFDNIICQSGQFGFFQKRLFLINTLIQSACISVLLYSCTYSPDIPEQEDECLNDNEKVLIVSVNGHHENWNLTDAVNGLIVENYTSVNATFSSLLASSNISSSILSDQITTISSLLPSNFTLFNSSHASPGFFNNSAVRKSNFSDSLYGNTSEITKYSSNSSFPWITNITDTITSSMFGTIENVTQIANKSLDTSTSKEELDSAAVTSTTTRLLSWSTGDLAERYNLTTISAPTTTTTHSSCEKTFMLLSRELEKTEILSGLGIRELHQLLSYTQGAGVIIGAGLGSMVADIYGRRRILYTSLSVMLVFHCLVALSISWVMFIFLRVVAAASAGATLVVSFVMVIEYLGPDWRDACTCSCLWTLGAILLSLEALVTSHWRWMALISGGIGLPLIGTFFTSHESVRWLQCQHRFTEAESGFREVISVNAGAVPDIMALLDHSRACIVNNMHQKKFTFIDLFHSIDSTKWTITLVYTCLISSCVYFCLLWRVRHITGSVYIDGFLPFLVDLPLTWSVIIVNRCLGRRWCLFLYSVASGFALLSVLVLHVTGNVAYMPSLVTGLALFGKIGVTASFSLIFLIAIEMYPTVTRCMGVAITVASASGGAMLSSAFTFLEQYHYTVPFVVYGAMMASIGVAGLIFPETIRRPLKNVQQCRHRKIPLMEGARLVGRPPNLWDAV